MATRLEESKDNVYKRENLASIAINQIQCLWLPKTILGRLFYSVHLFLLAARLRTIGVSLVQH